MGNVFLYLHAVGSPHLDKNACTYQIILWFALCIVKAVGREGAKGGKSVNRKNFEDTFMYLMVFFHSLENCAHP